MDESQEIQQLLTAMRAGDSAASSELFQRVWPVMRFIVRRNLHRTIRSRFDTLDFVQDVWASFLARPAEGRAFASPEAFIGYLTQMAQNKVAEVFRQRHESQKDDVFRERSIGLGVLAEPPSSVASPSQWVIADEAWEQILNRIPAGHRVIAERLREGYTHEDIARLTNISVSTISRIVRRLKKYTEQ